MVFVRVTGGAAWVTATVYAVGDYRANGGDEYRCISAHTSGDADDEPGTGAVWTTYWTNEVYTTINLGEDNIDRSGGDATLTIEEDTEFVENVTVGSAETGTNRLTITVGAAYRHDGKWGSGAQVTSSSKAFDAGPSYVTVEWFRIKANGTDGVFFFGEEGVITRRNLIMGDGGAVAGIHYRSETGSNEIHANVIWNCGVAGIKVEGGSATQYITHNNIYNCLDGIWHSGGTAANCFVEGNWCLGSSSNCFEGSFHTSSDHNISSDATAAALNSTVDHGTPPAHGIWESPDDGDMRVTESRQWPDDTISGFSLEDGNFDNFWTSSPGAGATFEIHADAAKRGSYGGKITFIDGETANSKVSIDFVESEDPHVFIWLKLDSGTWTMTNGDNVRVATIGDVTTLLADLRVQLTGAQYQITVRGFSENTSTVTIPVDRGTWYAFKFRRKSAATPDGIFQWWYQVAETGSWTVGGNFTSLETEANEFNRIQIGAVDFKDTGTSGDLFFDHLMVATSDITDEPDDATAPYGKTFIETIDDASPPDNYAAVGSAPSGPSYFPSTDITGAAWTDDNNGTYHIGANNFTLYEAPAGDTISLGILETVGELNDTTLTPGATSLSLSLLDALAELNDVVPSPGSIALTLPLLESLGYLNDVTVDAGGAAIVPGILNAVASILDSTMGAGPVSVVADLLDALAVLNDVSPSTGANTISLSLIEALGTLGVHTLDPGATSITLSILESVGALNDVVPSSGGASLVLDNLESVAELLGPSFALGAVSIAPGVLEAVAALLDPVVSSVAAGVGLDVLEAVGEILDPTFSPGGISFNLDLLEAVSEILDVTVAPGVASIAIDVLDAPASINDLALTPGTATLSVDVLEAVLVLLSPTFPDLITRIRTRISIRVSDGGSILSGIKDPGSMLIGSE